MLPSYVEETDLPGFGLLDRAPLGRGESFADSPRSPRMEASPSRRREKAPTKHRAEPSAAVSR